MSAGDALLDRLPRNTLVVGKGGVGKTTCAAALAIRASARVDTLILSTDPAQALPSVLEHAAGQAPTPLAYAPRLAVTTLDTTDLRTRFLERWGDVLRTILDRGTYLDETDIGPLLDTALPGGDEIFSALELGRLFAESGHAGGHESGHESGKPNAESRMFIDTAPTGHTLRLLALPQTFRALVRLLDAMQDKHRFMVRALTRGYRADAADEFIAEMGRLVSALEETLRDPSRCAAVLVTNDQPIVVEETRRYLDALRELRVEVAAMVWNGVMADVAGLFPEVRDQYAVPRLTRWPTGESGLRDWLDAMRPLARRSRNPASKKKPADEVRSLPAARNAQLLAALTIVAGKGGVGKTTVACAFALAAAATQQTLLVSTDPASSLADAFEQPIPDEDRPVVGVPNLLARQMDATAAFERLRAEYATRVDALFDALLTRGVDMAQDRAIVRDLLTLAPPGVDEVYALTLIADALFKDHYQRVIVDPAPTGHFLRLLEMPQLALAWTHQLMRLMLKYKDIAGLGETAQELLEFSRRLRSLDAVLKDPSRCGVILVTLAEPVVEAETRRLAEQIRIRGVRVVAVIHNRTAGRIEIASLPVTDAPVHFQAPTADPAPVGVDAIRTWGATWVSNHAS